MIRSRMAPDGFGWVRIVADRLDFRKSLKSLTSDRSGGSDSTEIPSSFSGAPSLLAAAAAVLRGSLFIYPIYPIYPKSKKRKGKTSDRFADRSLVSDGSNPLWASFGGWMVPRVPERRISKKGKSSLPIVSRIAPILHQITVDYLADTLNHQARLGFLHPQHSPRKGKVRNDAEMTNRRTRSRPEAATPDTARNARGTQAIRLPAPRLSEARAAARASRREERAAIARAAAILTTRKEPTYD